MTEAEKSKRYRLRHPDRARAATKRWREAHREDVNRLAQSWRQRNPEKNAAAIRKRTYGITDDEFQERRRTQDNRCAICQEVFTKTPCVDHDHVTGKNRDLLCRFCNLVLGNARDSILVLERSIQYLRKHGDL